MDMHAIRSDGGARSPRVLVPTARDFTRRAFQCGLYEAQDVLCEVDDVELLRLRPRPGAAFPLRERWQRRLLYRDVSRKLVFANPGLERVRLTQDYDLFVAVCANYWDLLYLNAIEGWRDRCRTTVCWLDEMWLSEISRHKYWLHVLNQFDHVFLGYDGSVDAVSRAIGRPCRWIGGGVDTMRFSPYPRPPARAIDVYSMGRSWAGIHEALLSEASTKGRFYLHDTLPASDIEPYDHRAHRSMLGNVAKRSRYFVVAPGKVNVPAETAGQVEIGFRYYEGSAAGAVMIGQAPNCRSFRERFDWPDAVIEVKPDGSDVVERLAALDAQPERLAAISRRNAAEALRRHDWLYRWQQIYEVAGVAPSPGMIARGRRLHDLARLADADVTPARSTVSAFRSATA
jgi:hypothetical protein